MKKSCVLASETGGDNGLFMHTDFAFQGKIENTLLIALVFRQFLLTSSGNQRQQD